MELNAKRPRSSERGISLVELLVAIVVLTVGVLGTVSLIMLAMGSNHRNRQQSNSTVIAQMVMEKIMSVPAGTSPNLTLTDCSGASNTISTTGSGGGLGATLLSSGDADFSQTLGSAGAPANYYMLYTTCGTGGRQSTYDVRWNIKTPSAFAKLIVVSVKLRGTGTDLKLFSPPVTFRSLTGQGS